MWAILAYSSCTVSVSSCACMPMQARFCSLASPYPVCTQYSTSLLGTKDIFCWMGSKVGPVLGVSMTPSKVFVDPSVSKYTDLAMCCVSFPCGWRLLYDWHIFSWRVGLLALHMIVLFGYLPFSRQLGILNLTSCTGHLVGICYRSPVRYYHVLVLWNVNKKSGVTK